QATSRIEPGLVGREADAPGPLARRPPAQHLAAGGVELGDPVGAAHCDIDPAFVLGRSHLDCHDRLVDLEALGEVDCALDLARRGIKHADRPALFGGYPNGAAVVEEEDEARAAAYRQAAE